MTRHKTHIDRDGILCRFMKCLFIAVTSGGHAATKNKSDRNSTPVFHSAHWHFTLKLFLMTDLHFSTLWLHWTAILDCKPGRVSHGVSVCTMLKCTLNHHNSWATGPKSLRAMLKLPMTHWKRKKCCNVIQSRSSQHQDFCSLLGDE